MSWVGQPLACLALVCWGSIYRCLPWFPDRLDSSWWPSSGFSSWDLMSSSRWELLGELRDTSRRVETKATEPSRRSLGRCTRLLLTHAACSHYISSQGRLRLEQQTVRPHPPMWGVAKSDASTSLWLWLVWDPGGKILQACKPKYIPIFFFSEYVLVCLFVL